MSISRVVGLNEARTELEKYWRPKPRIVVGPLERVSGRVMATDVVSRMDLPPFDRAAFDGYAVRAADTFGADEGSPIELRCTGEVRAGQRSKKRLSKRTCMEIATGAPLPKGTNAVVMVEHTSSDGETVKIKRAVAPEENVLKRGSELKRGTKIRCAGRKLTPQLVGTLAALGMGEITVYALPRVAVISSGDELVEPGKRLGPAEVYDVNGPTICNAVRSCGCEPVWLGVAPDEPSRITKTIKKGLRACDAVLISGGSSVGSGDIVPSVVEKLGKPGVLVHGLAMKPGKPTFIALVEGKPIFGLPGYPLSALMVFDMLVAPYLRRLAGLPELPCITLKAKIATKLLSVRGREELVPVKLSRAGGELVARPIRMGSSAITSLSLADGYVRVPLELEIVGKGETVEVALFEGATLA